MGAQWRHDIHPDQSPQTLWAPDKNRKRQPPAAEACSRPGGAGMRCVGSNCRRWLLRWLAPGLIRLPPPCPLGQGGTPPTSAECVKDFGIACYSPTQLQRAYDLAPLYAKGFDGKGRTIVIIDPYGSPTLAKDLATFDTRLGVPAPPSLRVLQPVGKVPAFNPSNAEMVQKAGETTGDVETAHEIAPGASIVVIETPAGETLSGGGFPQFIAADNYVATHHLGDVISQSFGLPEQNVKVGPAEPALRLRQ